MTTIMIHDVTGIKMEPIEALDSGTVTRKIRVDTKLGHFEVDLFLADSEPDETGLAIKI
jgi:hypothetical protein